MPRRLIVWTLLFAAMHGSGEFAFAQNFPNKPVRLITADPGGSSDFIARVIAQGLSGTWGQQVVVDNRGAASGIVASETLAQAPPDGYTLLLYGSGIWIVPLIRNVRYDPRRDFSPISLGTKSPNVLVVHPSLPVKSVKELIALAKARPGGLNFGTGGTGNSPHLASELFKYMARIEIVRVGYRGIAAAINALVGGELQLAFSNAAPTAPHVKSGRLRALAVTSAAPSPLFPGLPTIAATGLPGYESTSKSVIFAPAKTPAAIITRINQDIVRVLHQPEAKERLFRSGLEVVASSPAELTADMESEVAVMGRVVKAAGIRMD